MALHPKEAVYTIQGLATQLEVPAPSLSKAFQLLAKEGYLSSVTGRYGGFSFNRDPDEISLYDIMVLLDRQDTKNDQAESGHALYVFPQWRELHHEIEVFLKETSLADLTKSLQ